MKEIHYWDANKRNKKYLTALINENGNFCYQSNLYEKYIVGIKILNYLTTNEEYSFLCLSSTKIYTVGTNNKELLNNPNLDTYILNIG